MDPNSSPSIADAKLLVNCDSWHAFVEHYAADLTTGGMYVETDSAPALLSIVEVCLRLPEATEIQLRGRVVQVLGAQQASAVGKASGIGLELIDLDGERKRQVVQLIEFARWQGASNDPNASFTRTLLEVSQPLAAAEVGYRLSMMPAPPRTSEGPRSAHQRSGGPNAPNSKQAPARNSQPINRPSLTAGPPASPVNEAKTRGSRPSMSAAEPSQSTKTGSRPSMSAAKPDDPPSETRGSPSALPAAPANDAIPPQSKPTDQIQLKLVLTNFAHKHYDAALRVTSEMLESNPGDRQALRWQHMCNARLALARDEPAAAAQHFDGVLLYDPENREAREFVRNFRRDQKLNSLPFGRYFTKKK